MLRKALGSFLVSLLAISSTPSPVTAATKNGGPCKRLGSKTLIGGKTYVCTKSQKKLIWKISRFEEKVHKPTEPPPPDVPTSFADLLEKRRGISWAAWLATSQMIRNSKGRTLELKIYTGPNTVPLYDNFPLTIDLVTRAFPNQQIPKTLNVLRYNFADLSWAEEKMREILKPSDYEELQRNNNGMLVSSNCSSVSQNCGGSKHVPLRPSTSFILQGVPKDFPGPTRERILSGQGSAHEFFHALQMQALFQGPGPYNEMWTRRWLLEGGAEWAQNATTNYSSFLAYSSWLRKDCAGPCRRMSADEIATYLLKGNSGGNTFDQYLDYDLGSRVIEIFVALKGPEVVLQIPRLLAEGNSFEAVFREIFGLEWIDAVPHISAAIRANTSAGS